MELREGCGDEGDADDDGSNLHLGIHLGRASVSARTCVVRVSKCDGLKFLDDEGLK